MVVGTDPWEIIDDIYRDIVDKISGTELQKDYLSAKIGGLDTSWNNLLAVDLTEPCQSWKV